MALPITPGKNYHDMANLSRFGMCIVTKQTATFLICILELCSSILDQAPTMLRVFLVFRSPPCKYWDVYLATTASFYIVLASFNIIQSPVNALATFGFISLSSDYSLLSCAALEFGRYVSTYRSP
jgi:hypothetical protein